MWSIKSITSVRPMAYYEVTVVATDAAIRWPSFEGVQASFLVGRGGRLALPPPPANAIGTALSAMMLVCDDR